MKKLRTQNVTFPEPKPGTLLLMETRRILTELITSKVIQLHRIRYGQDPDFRNGEVFESILNNPIKIDINCIDCKGNRHTDKTEVTRITVDCSVTPVFMDKDNTEYLPKDLNPEELAHILDELEGEIHTSLFQAEDTKWGIYNRHGERLYQYGEHLCEETAQRALSNALKSHPQSGAHIERIRN